MATNEATDECACCSRRAVAVGSASGLWLCEDHRDGIGTHNLELAARKRAKLSDPASPTESAGGKAWVLKVGDRVRPTRADHENRDWHLTAIVIEATTFAGRPAFRVRWEDDGTTGIVMPGEMEPATPQPSAPQVVDPYEAHRDKLCKLFSCEDDGEGLVTADVEVAEQMHLSDTQMGRRERLIAHLAAELDTSTEERRRRLYGPVPEGRSCRIYKENER